MAKRSVVKDYSELEVDDELEADVVNSEEPEVTLVRVVSLSAGKKNVVVNDSLYTFDGAGSIVQMPLEDATKLLEKRNKSCCTGSVSKFFEIIEDG